MWIKNITCNNLRQMDGDSKMKKGQNVLKLIKKLKILNLFDYQYLLEIKIEIFREYFIRTCGINGIV